ncbi:hypothetical protein O0L34_g6778 [Tuta absoluta]|nr:hypothetical protein O0L34_g6778 [Tuta absoluta]
MEQLKKVLGGFVDDFEVERYNGEDGNYQCKIRCCLPYEGDYDKKCEHFIEKFSVSTQTNWIMLKRFSEATRYEFRKIFVCQLSERNKTKDKKNGVTRNYNCKANIGIKFLKVTKSTLKNSPLMKRGLNVLIELNFNHSHRVYVAQALSLLRCSEDTVKRFESYFESGMTAAVAKLYNEMAIIEECEANAYISLSNAQKNPCDRQVTHMYEQWRRRTYGTRDIDDVIEVLKRKKTELSKMNIHVFIKEEPTVCVIVTPVMQRVFMAGLGDEMVFIDTSGSCDQTNTCVTFIFAATKIGALPIVVILHTSQSEKNYTHCFQSAKKCLEETCQKVFEPKIAMTDDSSAERNALRTVFPNTRLLLCIFHVNQALWRWLWQSEHDVSKEDRQSVMKKFRIVMYADTMQEAEMRTSELLNEEKVKTNKKLEKHITNLWERREEWCLAYRSDILTRGNNTNNYCESSIRIFKDVVLQRCKVFNMCALLDFVANTFESYHKKRLIQFANGRARNLTLAYEKFCQSSSSIKDIVHMDDDTYFVKDKTDLYVVNCEMATCDCPSGAGGRFCKHLCAVEKKRRAAFTTSLYLDDSDRQQFAKLALGDQFSSSFFENITGASSTYNENRQTDSIISSNVIQESFELPMSSAEFNTTDSNEIYENAVQSIKEQWQRITDILEKDSNAANTKILSKFGSDLSKLQTPSSIISFIVEKNVQRRSRKIHVQPTSIARRKERGLPCSGRIQSGRPSKSESVKRKRVHNIASNIDDNMPPAKKH